ncbi:MAG: N-acetylglucosamine-6-phosphate deacetylase [Pseudomonadota bacterium]
MASHTMTALRIRAAQVFDGRNLLQDRVILLEDDVVTGIAADEAASDISLPGLITPGFVDLQVNGGGGVLLNTQPTAEGAKAIAAAHRWFGTVALMPTLITDHPDVLAKAVEMAIATKDDPSIIGLHIEGPHIAPQKRGTHAAAHIRPLDELTIDHVRTLRQAHIPTMITLAPEAAMTDQIAQLARMGAIVSLGHSNCTAVQAEAAFAAGASAVTHLYNAMSGLSGRAPGLAGAAINSHAYVGIIADGVHVDPSMIRLALRARPVPERSFIVSDAMPTVGGPDSFTLYGQEIRLQDGRLINSEGNLAGAHTTLADGVARLVADVGIATEEALRMAITVPATLAGRADLTTLIGRRAADIMVMGQTLTLTGQLSAVIEKQRA